MFTLSPHALINQDFEQRGQNISAGDQLKISAVSVPVYSKRLQNGHSIAGFGLYFTVSMIMFTV